MSSSSPLLKSSQRQMLEALLVKRGWDLPAFEQAAQKPLAELSQTEARHWITRLTQETRGKIPPVEGVSPPRPRRAKVVNGTEPPAARPASAPVRHAHRPAAPRSRDMGHGPRSGPAPRSGSEILRGARRPPGRGEGRGTSFSRIAIQRYDAPAEGYEPPPRETLPPPDAQTAAAIETIVAELNIMPSQRSVVEQRIRVVGAARALVALKFLTDTPTNAPGGWALSPLERWLAACG